MSLFPSPFILSLFPSPFILSLFPSPFILSLSKDASGRELHFDKLSANGFFRHFPELCSALDAELWRQKLSGLAGLRIKCGARLGATL